MIVDTLANAEAYFGLHPRLERAFTYLNNHDLSKLPLGRHLIDDDDIFINVQEVELKAPQDAPLEVHNTYIDIQVLIDGAEQERMGWRPRADCQRPTGDFDREKDVRFFSDPHRFEIGVRRGEFAIFLPEDAHAPMIGQGRVRKAIVKVRK